MIQRKKNGNGTDVTLAMLRKAERDDWQFWFDHAPVASFFQSPDWAEVWSEYTRGKFQPYPCFARLPSGREVLIPLSRQKILFGLGAQWHAAPAGTYGTWLSKTADPLAPGDIQALLQGLFSYCGSLTIRWFPLMGIPDEGQPKLTDGSEWNRPTDLKSIAGQPEFLKLRADMSSDHTRVIDCSGGFSAITETKKWRKGIRPKVNKATRAGVTVRRASSENDWQTYYRLYLASANRWDPPPSYIYSWRFFKILSEVRASDLWIAERDGRIAAGAILLHGRNHTAYWHGASDTAEQRTRAANLLFAKIIEDTCKKGQRWFDFNPNMGISGVDAFKKSFGALAFDAPVISRLNGTSRLIHALKKYQTDKASGKTRKP